MLKLAAAAIIATLTFAPAFAQEMVECTPEAMKKIEMMAKEKMEMKADVTIAMKESEKAMMAKEKGDMKDCSMHLTNAEKDLMKAQ